MESQRGYLDPNVIDGTEIIYDLRWVLVCLGGRYLNTHLLGYYSYSALVI